MRDYVLVFEYDSKKFMDLNKIIIFKENLKKVEDKNNSINIAFYGDASNEEMATFMSYFNNLLEKDICQISISFKTKSIINQKGINNKSIKLSAKIAKEIKDKNFDKIINEYYGEAEVKALPTKNWESIILDLINE